MLTRSVAAALGVRLSDRPPDPPKHIRSCKSKSNVFLKTGVSSPANSSTKETHRKTLTTNSTQESNQVTTPRPEHTPPPPNPPQESVQITTPRPEHTPPPPNPPQESVQITTPRPERAPPPPNPAQESNQVTTPRPERASLPQNPTQESDQVTTSRPERAPPPPNPAPESNQVTTPRPERASLPPNPAQESAQAPSPPHQQTNPLVASTKDLVRRRKIYFANNAMQFDARAGIQLLSSFKSTTIPPPISIQESNRIISRSEHASSLPNPKETNRVTSEHAPSTTNSHPCSSLPKKITPKDFPKNSSRDNQDPNTSTTTTHPASSEASSNRTHASETASENEVGKNGRKKPSFYDTLAAHFPSRFPFARDQRRASSPTTSSRTSIPPNSFQEHSSLGGVGRKPVPPTPILSMSKLSKRRMKFAENMTSSASSIRPNETNNDLPPIIKHFHPLVAQTPTRGNEISYAKALSRSPGRSPEIAATRMAKESQTCGTKPPTEISTTDTIVKEKGPAKMDLPERVRALSIEEMQTQSSEDFPKHVVPKATRSVHEKQNQVTVDSPTPTKSPTDSEREAPMTPDWTNHDIITYRYHNKPCHRIGSTDGRHRNANKNNTND